MRVVNLKEIKEIIGGWDPFGRALEGAQTGYNAGSSLLGPLGGTIGGILGLAGGFIRGFFEA